MTALNLNNYGLLTRKGISSDQLRIEAEEATQPAMLNLYWTIYVLFHLIGLSWVWLFCHQTKSFPNHCDFVVLSSAQTDQSFWIHKLLICSLCCDLYPPIDLNDCRKVDLGHRWQLFPLIINFDVRLFMMNVVTGAGWW